MQRSSIALPVLLSVAALVLVAGVGPVDASTEPPDDNLTVSVETPGTIVVNASQNYSVDVDGAEGNVTATWSFEGEAATGERVQHAFAESGNATIEVTVEDESGASVTKSRRVSAVRFGDDADDRSTSRNVSTLLVWVLSFFGMVFVLFLFVLPKGMQVLSDAL